MLSSVVSQQQVSVLLLDNHPRFGQGLQTLLQFYSDNSAIQFQIIGEVASLSQAICLMKEHNPSLIILDMELATGDGIATLTELNRLSDKTKVLAISGHRDEERVFRAMRAGASGYLVKDELATQLFTAITTILNRQIYLSPEMATCFFQVFRFYAGQTSVVRSKLSLTEREHEVLHWLVQGASNEDIATQLYISVATVKAHLSAIFNKLGVTSRTQAIIRALKMGLVMC
jgi:DNA-binding NarL/FixJ family response regulator